ncbi:MAG: RNA polymerase sigma-54 factor [Bacteroidetes bacterium]|nr:RNA polymerase sigma-54 factor [Bacteroidota bacterium]PHX82863.1 MAG: RNA polymerase sigma-54 factor [Flavobacteriales bacterium]
MLRQGLHQKMLQKLSPQQIQLMKMLQLPTVALEQRIKEEIELNPALEEGDENVEDEQKDEVEDDLYDSEKEQEGERKDDDFSLEDYINEDEGYSYKEHANNNSSDEERRESPLSQGPSFQDLLLSQLGLQLLTDHQYQVGAYLIGNIDEDGYMRRELMAVIDDLAFTQNIVSTESELKEILGIIQNFDPPGVGANDLKECLLLQLKRKVPRTPHLIMAIRIVQEHMDEFSKKHYEKIANRLGIDNESLKLVIKEITSLSPRPGSSVGDSSRNVQDVIPDFIVINNDGKLELSLNDRNMPDLRVSGMYSNMLLDYAKRKDKSSKEAFSFIKQKIDSAKWFMDALHQRQQTLLLTIDAILDYQQKYFLDGDETKLRPMILKDIADRVNLDISTVSRVANSKYVQTQFGTFLLKSFFSESLTNSVGEEVSTREVKKILLDVISAEDKKKPVTDDLLTKILKEKGYNIARRTVAKYREQLDISVARLRKEI